VTVLGLTARRFTTIGIILTALTVSCGSVPPTAPATSFPTPTATSLPTETPEPAITPTPDWTLERIKRDRLAEQLLVEADALAADARRVSGENRALDVVRHYVPVYLASACVEGKEPSVEDFKVFTSNAIGNRRLVEREARGVIRVIIGAADSWRNQSLDAATQHCLKPYLYPESVPDATPAVELFLAASLPPLSPLVKGGFGAQVRDRADGWFNQTDNREPYISWLCGSNC